MDCLYIINMNFFPLIKICPFQDGSVAFVTGDLEKCCIFGDVVTKNFRAGQFNISNYTPEAPPHDVFRLKPIQVRGS
jgi:hypothetical protein